MKHEDASDAGAGAILEAARELDLDLERDRAEVLVAFERLLADRALPLGMIAASDASRLRERHLLDCLRAAQAVRLEDRLALDLGSGAGLPGLVVAIVRPELDVRLVERRRARAAFLELAIERLGVPNARVLPVRVEDVDEGADLCFARAFAPLPAAWKAARRLLRPEGRLVYFAGASERGAFAPEVPQDVTTVEVVETPVLASSGSLIIMSR